MNELYINDSRIDLDKETKIAISSQINTLPDLRDHNSNLTNRFKVPRNNNNTAALENAGEVQSGSWMPYRKSRARLIMGGVPVVQNGYAIIESSDDYFNITVYSGNVDFFELIEKRSLQDLDLSDLDHLFDYASVKDSITNTEVDGYKYPIVDYGQLTNDTRTIDPSYLRPFYFASYLFKKIITDAGIDYAGDFFTKANFLRLLVSGGNDNFKSQYFDTLGRFAFGEEFDIFTASPPYNYNWFDIPDSVNYEITVKVWYKITAWTAGVSEFGFNYFNTVLDHIDADGVGTFVKTETGSILIPGGGSAPFTIISHECSWQLLGGEISYKRVGIQEPDAFIHIKPTNSYTAAPDSQVYVAFDFNVQYALSIISVDKDQIDISQKDFIKAIGHIFGLMFRTSTKENKIYIKQFSEIVDSIPIAVDWTNKLDRRENGSLEYQIGGYSQINYCKYRSDETDKIITDEYGNGEILIDDETLASEQTSIQLPFAASLMKRKLINLPVAQINQIDADSGVRKINTVPRLLYDNIETLTGDPVTYDDGTTSTNVTDIPLPYFIRPDKSNNLGFSDSILKENYAALTATLNQSKKIRKYFKLTPSDIYSFTEGDPLTEGHFIPRYLRQYAAYFYVSRIINYTGEDLTQVELIKIGSEDLSLLDVCFNVFAFGNFDVDQVLGDWTISGGVMTSAAGSPGLLGLNNSLRKLKLNKCYKLVYSYENSGSDKEVEIRLSNHDFVTGYNSIPANTAGVYVSESFSFTSITYQTDLEIDLIDLGSDIFKFNFIKIVSCDCTDYD